MLQGLDEKCVMMDARREVALSGVRVVSTMGLARSMRRYLL